MLDSFTKFFSSAEAPAIDAQLPTLVDPEDIGIDSVDSQPAWKDLQGITTLQNGADFPTTPLATADNTLSATEDTHVHDWFADHHLGRWNSVLELGSEVGRKFTSVFGGPAVDKVDAREA